MIRSKDYSETSSESCSSDDSTSKSCYVCQKIEHKKKKKSDKRSSVIYVQKEEACSGAHLFFSENEPNTGLRYIGLGSSGPVFANGSYILCKDESVNRMCVAVKDVGPIGVPFNIQFTLVFARCDSDNNYSSGVIQTHLSTIVQIPASGEPQSRCSHVKISPSVCLEDCDLIGVLVNPTNLEIPFQATASACS
jgi:hypothetical protein